MKAWLKPLGYSDTINEAAINFILRDFVMSKVRKRPNLGPGLIWLR